MYYLGLEDEGEMRVTADGYGVSWGKLMMVA